MDGILCQYSNIPVSAGEECNHRSAPLLTGVWPAMRKDLDTPFLVLDVSVNTALRCCDASMLTPPYVQDPVPSIVFQTSGPVRETPRPPFFIFWASHAACSVPSSPPCPTPATLALHAPHRRAPSPSSRPNRKSNASRISLPTNGREWIVPLAQPPLSADRSAVSGQFQLVNRQSCFAAVLGPAPGPLSSLSTATRGLR